MVNKFLRPTFGVYYNERQWLSTAQFRGFWKKGYTPCVGPPMVKPNNFPLLTMWFTKQRLMN